MTTDCNPVVRRALLSVSDKTGLVEFARALEARGVALLSTGGTAAALTTAGLTVTQVSEYTQSPEIMDGRVKTLHPKIHGGILGRGAADADAMASQGIEPIDLVVVNLYPFAQTIARPDCSLAEAIEQIDIGGPAMLRAAAKNHVYAAVVADPADYPAVLTAMQEHGGGLPPSLRLRLAAQAFAHSAAYDGVVADYLGARCDEGPAQRFGTNLNLSWRRALSLRYGENPHQQAAFYAQPDAPEGGLAGARQLQGKALSYNNLADADAALACARAFGEQPACVIVKHANPCGVALGRDLEQAYRRAFATDPTSAFGGVIAFNQPLDAAAAGAILATQFAEVVVAPAVPQAALAVFSDKKNLRVLATGSHRRSPPRIEIKQLDGGVLAQEPDDVIVDEATLQIASRRPPTADERTDLLFAWRVAKFVKSNAIVYARGGATVGIGAGQMSRVDSARIAAQKAAEAGLAVTGAVMASDAFFPFRDGVDTAAAAGITALIHPGGSIRDREVIAAADEAGMAMLLTGLRHFRH